MYVLYWYPDSSSMAPMAVLEETGAAYEAVKIDIVAGENFSPAYKKIHPYGRVPALKLPDGRAVFESAGLVMYLADRHPEAGLAPMPQTPERAAYYQWLLFMADSLYPSYNRYFRTQRYAKSPEAQAQVQTTALATLAEQFQCFRPVASRYSGSPRHSPQIRWAAPSTAPAPSGSHWRGY